MNSGIGIRALAVSFPETVRTNDYFRKNYPQLVADAEAKALARLWSPQDNSMKADTYEQEMTAYLSDPFRGSVERRVLDADQTALSIELRAANAVLKAARLAPHQIDLALVCSFLPDQIGPGNAAFLARELGLKGTAWNIESTCSGGMVALETAAAMVQTGRYATVLVVISCTYSRLADYSDTLCWYMGDGAGAFIVTHVAAEAGVLGVKSIHTGSTCDTFFNELTVDSDGSPRIRIGASPTSGRIIRDISGEAIRRTCTDALELARVRLEDIDFFIFSSALAWFPQYCARTLGVSEKKTISTYPLYGNIGPALMTTNLYHAARDGHIRQGDLVLVHTIGSVSTTGAAVMRWGDVALGPTP